MKIKIHYRPFNSGGKGGQHGNRSMNAIEASCTLPDGRTAKATSQTSKSQHRNRKQAASLLASRVRGMLAKGEERRETAGWGNADQRVRTYHEPDDRVVDSAGPRHSYAATVGKGDLTPCIEGRIRALGGTAPAG